MKYAVRAAKWLAPLLAATLLVATPVLAGETVTYTYDELGRLVATSTSGAINNGQAVSTTFDPAGNRTSYTVNGVAPAALGIGSTSITEGGTLVFTVTRSGNAAIAASASYATANGTALAGSDYSAASGTVSFAANQTTATINIATTDDTVVESAETLTVTLSTPSSGATIATATGTGTINDNDVAPADLAISGASVTEGGNLSFTVTRSGNTAPAVAASYATANGSALAGNDYSAGSGTVSFAANQTTATISISTIDDTVVEAAETLTVTLSAPSSGAAITTAVGTGTINDNDVDPANLAIGDASITEGGPLVFTVTRSGNIAPAVSASYTSANGTALAGSDYTASSGTVSFAANQTTATISIATTDDLVVEAAETLAVTLSAPSSGAALTTATGTGTINDNDVDPANLAIGSASVTEGGSLVFTATRSGNLGPAVSASYATANGSAQAGSDYSAASGTVSFAANQTTATINIATTDDTVVESTETLTVTLSTPSSGATLVTPTGAGTIIDNDVAPPTLAIGNASATEGATLLFTVTRTGDTAPAVSASYAAENGVAWVGSDYIATSGTVSFAANQTTATIGVPTIDDAIEEADESMRVALSNPTGGATIPGQSQYGNGLIIDNEPHTNTVLTDPDFNVLEQHQGTYRCGYTANLAFSMCVLVQNSVVVYDASLSNPFDPYYSLTTYERLQVETPYYGIGVAP